MTTARSFHPAPRGKADRDSQALAEGRTSQAAAGGETGAEDGTTPTSTAAAESRTAPDPHLPQRPAADPHPAAAPTDPLAVFETEVTSHKAPAAVRLIGTRPGRWGAAYGWLLTGQQPPRSGAPVALGEADGRRLWIDLTMAPDVLTVLGAADDARRLVRSLVTQLGDDIDVVVVGDALGADVPGRCRQVSSAARLEDDRLATRTRVVVCAGADVPGLWTVLSRASHGPHRTVPIVVGAAHAARWSIRLGSRT